jgi:NADH-quinone oxidoreductase subunit C
VLGEAAIVVEPDQWMSLAKWLASDGGFGFLSDLCAVDWPTREERFEVVYNLTDIDDPARLRVKLPVSGEDPKVPSVTSIWPTANWHEREAYDMFGIIFDGHPDLRRILMPDEWEGHPLRKDYAMGKVPVEYKSLSPGF